MNTKSKRNIFADKDSILALMRSQNRPLRVDALIRLSGCSRKQKKELDQILQELEDEGKLVRFPGGKWTLAEKQRYVSGRFSALESGAGFVDVEGAGKDKGIFILPHHANGAWHKDLVRVALEPGTGGRSGKIVEIISRDRKEIPARILKRQGKVLLCRPVERRLPITFEVPLREGLPVAGTLGSGSLVLLHPEKELSANLWSATLLNIFGSENRIDVQENLVKCGHNVPREFPDLALAQARTLPGQPLEEDFSDREDLRNVPFVTIDGADARDFDDAIHVEKNASGWILRVAIADVSHYVLPDSRFGSLDQEALQRGNSWYFPTSVEPMLPKILSNGLCSLKPHEDRLAMLAEIHFDKQGSPMKSRFANAVIRSAGRLVYEEAHDFFRAPDKIVFEDKRVAPMLMEALGLWRVLTQASHERGALDFELPDPEYKFDASGSLASMGVAERNEAHKLIEQFMIAANEAVANFLGDKGARFLYRVHPAPEHDKLLALFDALRATSVEILPPGLTPDDLRQPRVLQQILERAKGTPNEYVVNRLCLRSMSQARYQPENAGHFGLASPAYCHFTSPIRRYADLLTHRALKNALNITKTPSLPENILVDIGTQLNKLEREAMECEREMAKRLACVALHDKEGEKASGTISGVTDFGLFVELDSIPAEGLLRIQDLGDDFFNYDEKKQCLVARRSGRIWKLGQPVKVRVEHVDMDRMEIRLALAETKKLPSHPRKKSLAPRQGHKKGISHHKYGKGTGENKPAVSKRGSTKKRASRKNRRES